MTRRHGRGWTPAVLAAVVLTAGFAVLTGTTLDFPEGASAFPLFVLAGGTVLLGVVAVRNLRPVEPEVAGATAEVEASKLPATDTAETSTPSWRDRRVLGFLLLWVLYPVVLMAIGFLIATALVLAASLAILRIRRLWLWLAGVVPVTLVAFALLQVLLNIALPQGPVDQAVADFLYQLRG